MLSFRTWSLLVILSNGPKNLTYTASICYSSVLLRVQCSLSYSNVGLPATVRKLRSMYFPSSIFPEFLLNIDVLDYKIYIIWELLFMPKIHLATETPFK
jgi:hypothetical protein